MRTGPPTLAALAAVLLAGCGSPASDIFEVERSGSIPGADLRIVVADDGTVRCNGGAPKNIGDVRLLDSDRKSTRLNSSHVAISYAVFCLKKKKITDDHGRTPTRTTTTPRPAPLPPPEPWPFPRTAAFLSCSGCPRDLHPCPTRRSSDLDVRLLD